MDEQHEQGAELSGKVADWLSKEGYPLEYFAAHNFLKAGFRVEQGSYIRARGNDPREIDLLASMAKFDDHDLLVRSYTVVECKWAKHKPWVAFTAPTCRIMDSALIAQSVGSELGEAAIYVNAGEPKLRSLAMFESPEKPAFGGRQALGKDSDVFYNSLRSVATAAHALTKGYNGYRGPDNVPTAGVLAFPLIVIDGLLFEAAYDPNGDKMSLQAADHVRLHWSGEPTSPLRTTIDVVTRDGIPAFVEARAKDTKVLLEVIHETCSQLHECYRTKSLKPLVIKPAATGISGRPSFLRLLARKAGNNELG